MSENVCRVCRSPVDLGARACGNCGTAYEAPRQQSFAGASKGGANALPLALGVLGTLAAGGAVAYTALQGGESSEPMAVMQSEAPSSQPEAVHVPHEPPAVPVPEAVEAPVAVDEPSSEPAEESQQGLAPAEPVTLGFGARVKSATGKKLSRGGKCHINLHVLGKSIDDLDISCGELVLYDSRTPLNGMSSYGGDFFERAKGGGWVYRVVYSDTGPRSGRAQLRLSSPSEQATVFSESDDAFSVELDLDEFSEARVGASLFDSPPAPATLGLTATLKSETGAVPKVTGRCTLSSAFVETSDQGPLCKTELRCGSAVLYGKGSAGNGPCEIRDGSIVTFHDLKETHEDGDPFLRLDVNDAAVELRDSPAQQQYTLSFGLGE